VGKAPSPDQGLGVSHHLDSRREQTSFPDYALATKGTQKQKPAHGKPDAGFRTT